MTLYTLQQNNKLERLNYLLMFMIRSVLYNKQLFKSLWRELIQTVFYLKNWLLYTDNIILYEKIKDIKPSLSHLKVLEACTWIYISLEKKYTKLDSCSWQDIFIDYEDMNQYYVYDLQTGKIHVS